MTPRKLKTSPALAALIRAAIVRAFVMLRAADGTFGLHIEEIKAATGLEETELMAGFATGNGFVHRDGHWFFTAPATARAQLTA